MLVTDTIVHSSSPYLYGDGDGNGVAALTSFLTKNKETLGSAIEGVGSIKGAINKNKSNPSAKIQGYKSKQPLIVVSKKANIWSYVAIGIGVGFVLVVLVVTIKNKK